ncbi:hypothetical protein HDR61_02265 [bacterium]|nr:hypothetical protein [bacterium]
MKSIARVLFMVLAFAPYAGHAAAPLSGTAGSNLTAYNPNGSGAANNNAWNSMTNGRTGGGAVGTPATADFGNCNSVILRCASPKCAGGGCASIEIATPIVSGCVMSNSACKQYADQGLVETIAAQLVAQSTAKTNAQMAAAQAASAEQSAQQMEQMQAQMQQMQQQMAEQNAQQIAQLQSALEEQQRATENALAQAAAAAESASAPASIASGVSDVVATSGASTTPETVIDGLTESQRIAAAAGVSADILAREQVAGQIMTYLENAQVSLKNAQAAMQEAFSYAGCDTKGDNCSGPKRVSVFRQKAMEFFDPYDAVLDDLYDALILAQSVGIDITDIYMMLNGSCNVWGEYLCYGGTQMVRKTAWNPETQKLELTNEMSKSWATYSDGTQTDINGNKIEANCVGGKSKPSATTRGGMACTPGAVIPPEDSPACTLNRTLTDMEEVQRNYLFANTGDMDENVRIGCASSALESSKFFRNRKKGSSIDIETLQRMVSQDAPAIIGSNRFTGGTADPVDRYKYCALTTEGYMNLERAVSTKKLPSKVCVPNNRLRALYESGGQITDSAFNKMYGNNASGSTSPYWTTKEMCESPNVGCEWDDSDKKCKLPDGMTWNAEDGTCKK